MSERSLHVLHVVPYFYPAWAYGGIPRLVYGLGRGLVESGVRVSVLTTDAFDAHSRSFLGLGQTRIEGIGVTILPNLSNRLAYRHQAFLPLGIESALRRIDLAGVDLIHLHGHRNVLNYGVFRHARRRGIPCVMTPNGTLPPIERKIVAKKVFDLFFGEPVLRGIRRFIAVSRAEVAQFRAAGIPANRISLIPNGVDLAEFDPLPRRGLFRRRYGLDGHLILYLGKLTPRKGVDHLIEAFARIGRSDVTLVIAGNDMGIEGELRAKVKRLALGERVLFVGLLTGPERLAALADADVLAYPSTLEIFGLVPFEGLLAGAPAVVGDDCGCGELVQEARAGVLVRYGDVRALSDALHNLLDRPRVRRAMVERGRRFIRSRFAWSRVVPMTLNVYRAVLNEG